MKTPAAVLTTLSIAASLLAPLTASAKDRDGGRDRDERRNAPAVNVVAPPAPRPARMPVYVPEHRGERPDFRVQQAAWEPRGHYELRSQRTWVPPSVQQVWVPESCRRDWRHGGAELCRPGFYENRTLPGHFEQVSTQVWVGGHGRGPTIHAARW